MARPALWVLLCFLTAALAHAQQQPPPAKPDKLLDRLYPGNSREIERRLATTATLAATPLANRPAATPAPLVFKLRRAQKADRPTSASSYSDKNSSPALAKSPKAVSLAWLTSTSASTERDATPTTSTMPIAPSPQAPPTAVPTPVSTPKPANGADVATYLKSLAPSETASPATSKSGSGKTPPAAVPVGVITESVNVNRADAAELMRILKIDIRRARMIIEFRKQQGRLRGPDDLAQVNGLTDDMILKWEQRGLLRFD